MVKIAGDVIPHGQKICQFVDLIGKSFGFAYMPNCLLMSEKSISRSS